MHGPANLGGALVRAARAVGASIVVVQDDFTRWASTTFDGGQHLVKIEGRASAELDAWLDQLEGSEIRIPGHLVVELKIATLKRNAADVVAHLCGMTLAEA